MAIQSINTLQNKDNYNSIAEAYLLESLANLGQRYNVKGDSISIGNLTLSKLFNISNADIINKDTLCVIKKAADEYSIYLINKNEYGDWDFDIPISGTSVFSTNDNELYLDSFYLPNNPGVQYSNVNIVSLNGFYDIYGRQDYNVSLNKTNYFHLRFRKSDNKLVRGIRIYKKHFSSDATFADNKYVLVQLTEDTTNIYKYKADLYVSNNNVDAISDSEIFSFISSINIASGISNNNSLFSNVTSDTLSYNNYLFDVPSSLMNIFSNENDKSILKNYVISSFSDDSINLYNYLIDQYSSSKYGKLDTIYVELFKSLYDTIAEEEPNIDCVFIPCLKNNGEEYTISYSYNTNNPEIIYFSGKEIEINYISDAITSKWLSIYLDEYRDNIFAHTEGVARTSFYFFETSISESGLVNGIFTRKISTLPYIDDNGYWIIDERNTGIYARGKSAGNPNIIIVETTNIAGGKNILSGAKRHELLEELTWDAELAYIEPLEKINLNSLSFKNQYDYLKVYCSIPNLSKIPDINKEDYLAMLENSLIINISPISCIKYDESNINYSPKDVEEMYGEYGVITTLWVLNDNHEFQYIRKQNNKYAAADFNYISNINNLIQHAVKNVEALHPDNYEFTNLVFDSTYTTLKNNTTEVNTYIYPNLINKKSGEYGISNYNNDINFTFKANNVCIKKDNIIDSLSQSGDLRFYNSTYNSNSNTTNTVTNSLYQYYKEGVSGRYNEYIPNYNVPSLDLSEVLTRNETLLNRLNILSFDSKGTSYLSYIGTSFEDAKNILKIGTSVSNINMGSDTLLYENDRNTFSTQSDLHIDFDNVKVNGNESIKGDLSVDQDVYLLGNSWNKDYIEMTTENVVANVTYYTSLITPVARYIYEVNDNYGNNAGIVELHPVHGEVYTYLSGTETVTGPTYDDENPEQTSDIYTYNLAVTELSDSNTNLTSLLSVSLYNYSLKKNKLYVISTIPEYFKMYNRGGGTKSTICHKVYFSDSIYIPVLLTQIGLEKFVTKKDGVLSLSNINITSNMNIIYVNNNPMLLVSSSTNLYPDKYLYNKLNNSVVDANVETIVNFTYTVFTGNTLKITYYILGGKLNIHIEEVYGKNKFVTTKKFKNNYII